MNDRKYSASVFHVLFTLVLIGEIVVVGFGIFVLVNPQVSLQAGVLGVSSIFLGVITAILTIIVWGYSSRVTAQLRRAPEEGPKIAPAAPPPKPSVVRAPDTSAIMLTSLLQEKGRFLDFVMEEIAAYSDEQIGAAARVVHQGCREVILDSFAPEPITSSKEQSQITLEKGFSPSEYRLTGKVNGQPPYTGILRHKGWRAQQIRLPHPNRPESLGEKPVLFPSEVEL